MLVTSHRPAPAVPALHPLLAQGWQHHQHGAWEAAAGCYRKFLRQTPDHADAQHLLAMVRERQGKADEALRLYEGAARRKPDDAKIWFNMALLLGAQERTAAAAQAMERAAFMPGAPADALPMLFLYRRQLTDWRDFTALTDRLSATRDPQRPAAPPFFTFWLDDPALQRIAATRAAARFPAAPRRPSPRSTGGRRIRIGYLGADFRAHPTARLLAGVLECHDRARFETFILSTGADDASPERRRIMAAGEHVLDLAAARPAEALPRIAALDLDILVDLMGHTTGARGDILAARPAPIQVAMLGFPGTSGAAHLDYLIADATVAPPELAPHISEQLVHLPDCYQANDALADAPPAGDAPAPPLRQEAGLPAQGIVFCSFNGVEKLDPDQFDLWASVLARVPDSVLWLMAPADAQPNLRGEAAARGLDPARLVFAERVPHARHRARLALADIALDTFPCTGHTTTSDMIRAGVPVITRPGRAFASRVAASLLHCCGLDDLVTADAGAYASLAVHLATDHATRADVARRVALGRNASPLFRPQLYARHLESAFTTMLARHAAGLAPQAFAVARLAEA
ncbi:hypothetical protein GCM10007301_21490 [Azorhizobium oxalatiphilum]|uniref:protein O-GlcNAc transferase n=1 Tax=Azorhizobium oxalatiphilum TaxID=980631 RepID=A0A917BYM5_9HYPH|nr:tetratricopeptide repeat protein [Azorhizobium oxalatiphilum]GGF61435.1 hypothetical protein GCM10007301_21490 [Azorhizobium oxalatiphilum]